MPFISGALGKAFRSLVSGFFSCCSSMASCGRSTFLFSESPQVGMAGRESSLSGFLDTSKLAYCGGSALAVGAGRCQGIAPVDIGS